MSGGIIGKFLDGSFVFVDGILHIAIFFEHDRCVEVPFRTGRDEYLLLGWLCGLLRRNWRLQLRGRLRQRVRRRWSGLVLCKGKTAKHERKEQRN